MKTPQTWDIMLKNGVITPEILDACATAAQSRMTHWKNNLHTAHEQLNKLPDSTARKRNVNNAEYMVEFYNKQLTALLSSIIPDKITRTWSDNANDFLYHAHYNILDNTYTVFITQKKAFNIMENHDVDVLQSDEIPTTPPEITDIVSHYLVNRVIATTQIYDVNYQESPNSDTINTTDKVSERELITKFA